MKKFTRIFLLLGLLVIGYFCWVFLFPNPKEVIHRRLEKIAQLASFTGGSGNISRAISVERFGNYFSDDAQIIIDIPGMMNQTWSKTDLMQSGMAMRGMARGLEVELLDMEIELGTGGETALVDTTLKAKVGGESELIWQELKFTLKKIKGDWLISRVETVKTLKP